MRAGRVIIRPKWPVELCTFRSNTRLNQPKKPRLCSAGVEVRRSSVTHSAGVKIKATSTESAMADTIVMENRSEEHTSELQSLMRISYAVFCLKKKKKKQSKTKH